MFVWLSFDLVTKMIFKPAKVTVKRYHFHFHVMESKMSCRGEKKTSRKGRNNIKCTIFLLE